MQLLELPQVLLARYHVLANCHEQSPAFQNPKELTTRGAEITRVMERGPRKYKIEPISTERKFL